MIVAANGSINYGLDTSKSDVDTKAIYVPSLEDITTQFVMSKSYNITHHARFAEKCDVKDVREYLLNMLLKGNINFMETLYSDYIWVNPKYTEEWVDIIRMRDDIAYGAPVRSVECMMGMASRYAKMIKDGKPIGKPLYHMCRMQYALKHYTQEDNYSKVIRPDEHTAKYLKAIKDMVVLNAGDALRCQQLAAQKMIQMERDYEQHYKPWAVEKNKTIGNDPAWIQELTRITMSIVEKGIQ